MEGICDVVEVASVHSGDRDAAVQGHVDCVFLAQLVDLVLVQSRESEHTNLAGNVAPVVFVAKLLKFFNETGSHLSHAGRHILEVLVPHGGEFLVSEDNIHNAGSVNWRV